eukprot:7777851-Pyramimonas_sp.AAC.1
MCSSSGSKPLPPPIAGRRAETTAARTRPGPFLGSKRTSSPSVVRPCRRAPPSKADYLCLNSPSSDFGCT